MFRSWLWLLVGGLPFAISAVNLLAQEVKPAVPAAKLPITRVVLSNAGIGYFHREGTVDGTARVELSVHEDDVNDLILTLLASDPQGAARSVSYDNRAPAEVALKSFSIDLAANPSVGSLLHQVRGESIEITTDDKTPLIGSIVSVQQPQTLVVPAGENSPNPTVVPPAKGEVDRVNLLTTEGLVSVELATVRRVKFVKPELQEEFRKALAALAASRGEGRKQFSVTFNGNGARKVSLGYVAESPIWKPTYRLNLSPQGSMLQCLAAVENTSDEDWEAIGVKLVSHQPIAYRMDLYEPLFVPRPTVEPELYASLRPPIYQAAVTQGGGILGGNGQAPNLGGPGSFAGGFGGQLGNLGNQFGVQGGGFTTMNGVSSGRARHRLTYEELVQRRNSNNIPFEAIPKLMPEAGPSEISLGETFEYAIKDPVTLPRFKSALLPVLDEKVTTMPLSIYNPAAHRIHPLKGLRLTNTSKLFLAAGPVVIYDGDSVAGQARLADVKPGESRLLSYAIDLDVSVKHDERSDSTLTKISIRDGALLREWLLTSTNTYAANNRGPARPLWVTQAIRDGWKLTAPAKPIEITADLQRFELMLPASDTATLTVKEQRTDVISTALERLALAEMNSLIANAKTTPAVREALGRLVAIEAEKATVTASLREETSAIEEIVKDQQRQRSNLATLPKESDAYKRYVKKFDEQETEIESRRAKVKTLEAKVFKLTEDLTGLRKELKAE